MFTISPRNIIAIIFILISLACLYPGLTYPMLNIYVGVQLPLLGELQLYDETQSIVNSIKSLFDSGNALVAWLILLFSVIVPILKAVILFLVLLLPSYKASAYAYRFVSVIGKWSMADVFVVAIFMAYLAGQANANISATLYEGFYYFAAYCIISIIGIQLIQVPKIDQ